MAESFPTLSINPTVEEWTEEFAFDPTISTKFEGGYRKTRPRCTRIPLKWHLAYKPLPSTDKATLREHELDRKVGASSFTWVNPTDSTTYTVRFLGPVKYAMAGNSAWWHVSFDLEEV